MSRFDDWVRSAGEDPDARFSLANERTFLSWITTSLGFLGFGLALSTIPPEHSPLLTGISGVWIALAAVLAVRAAIRWFMVERAIRCGQPLPLSGSILLVAGAVAVLSVASAAAVALAE